MASSYMESFLSNIHAFLANITLNREAEFLKAIPLWEALCKLEHYLQILQAIHKLNYTELLDTT